MIRVSPNFVDKHWKLIEKVLKACLPPKEHMGLEALFTIRAALVDGDMQCWLQKRDRSPVSITVTSIYMDRHTGARALLIYAWYVFETMTGEEQEAWKNGLIKFKDDRRLHSVVAIRKEI